MKVLLRHILWGGMVIALAASSASAATNVAVFNFQMKSDTPDWVWLEKGLADRIATDFTQSIALAVTARDEMQVLAQKLHWVPEMATADAGRMKQIRTRLRIQSLVSGVYAVKDGQLTITGQIVDVSTRKELARKVVAGKTDDVLKLQRQLSAELMSWFTKKPAENILRTLPVWTRSIPAMKALYEGMHLYDQGRYAEGWLKFRQAAREDREYVEAQYWVGKMYYFMSRYEHARRALEKFAYIDKAHPRIGDAVLEYLHTYETGDTALDSVLNAYAGLRKRFPEVRVPGDATRRTYEEHLKQKAALLLELADRPIDAIAMWGSGEYTYLEPAHYRNVRRLKALTGNSPGFDTAKMFVRGVDEVVFFEESAGRVQPKTIETQNAPGFTRIVSGGPFRSKTMKFAWIPPDGYVVKSIRLQPVTKAKEGTITVTVSKDALGDVAVREGTLSKALKEGMYFDKLPRAALLLVHCTVQSKVGLEMPSDVLSNIERKTTFEKLGPSGRIEVACTTSADFAVDVDGRMGRTYAGIIGMVPPGEHTLRFYPVVRRAKRRASSGGRTTTITGPGGVRIQTGAEGQPEPAKPTGPPAAPPESPYGEWTTKVTVQASKTVRVTGHLPWKKASPESTWTEASLAGKLFPGPRQNRLDVSGSFISVQADPQGIRLVWSSRGDIWYSVSTDGKTFSPSRRIPLPVSSGWSEQEARCVRDESGRFILTFTSNRDAQHTEKLYVSWSRDFIHWSNPAMVELPQSPRLWTGYDIFADNRGRLLLTTAGPKDGIRVFASTDAYRWKLLGALPVRGPCQFSGMIQRKDGKYELFAVNETGLRVTRDKRGGIVARHYAWRLLRLVSNDAAKWDQPELICKDETRSPPQITAARVNDLSLVSCRPRYRWYADSSAPFVVRETANGSWEKHALDAGFAKCRHTLAHHPKWGMILAWADKPQWRSIWSRPISGPYVMRGADVDKRWYAKIDTTKPKPPVTVAKKPPSKPAKPKPKPAGPPGQLQHVAQNAEDSSLAAAPLRVEGKAHFKKPRADLTMLTSRAKVVTVKPGKWTFHVAIDQTEPQLKYPDKLYVDFSGKGDFKEAQTVKRTRSVITPGQGEALFEFYAKSLTIPRGDRSYPAHFMCRYEITRRSESLAVTLGTAAKGTCLFGQKRFRVHVLDANSNLQFNDAVKLLLESGVFKRFGSGDFVWIQAPGDPPSLNHAHAAACYGQPVCVNGVLYDLKVAEDGTKVSATPLAGVTAKIQINHPTWSAWLLGPKYFFQVSGGSKPIPVPPGRYIVWGYKEILRPRSKNTVTMNTTIRGLQSGKTVFTNVVAGKTNEIAVGTPLTDVLEARRQGDQIQFRLNITDAGGRAIVDIRTESWGAKMIRQSNWANPPAPKVTISDSRGKVINSVQMKYSRHAQFCTCHGLRHDYATGSWQIPGKTRGTFKAVVEWDPQGLEFKSKGTAFTVK